MNRLRVLWWEYISRRDARDPNGIGRFDYACFRCNTDDDTCCAGCECCWPPGQCHGEAAA
jgi:hypothetical protein